MSGTASQKPDDGGPAFPAPEASFAHFGTHDCYLGMTLRDYFAAKAMQAYASSEKWRYDMSSTQTAFSAYALADAMLAARQQ